MDLSFTQKKNIRKNFGKLSESLSIPNLIEVQKNSYEEFLTSKASTLNSDELTKGINRVFKSIFPIDDGVEKSTLEFVSYRLEKPKFDVIECRQRSLTYSASLKATLRLVVYDIDAENNTKQILSAKEQEVFIGELPLMTSSGTFVVNGVERVVVNQMHRSPGVFFDHDKGKTHASGKLLFNCRIIPGRGSWLDFEYDPKDLMFFRIDRKKKLYITTLLYALGLNREQIINTFYDVHSYELDEVSKLWRTQFNPENFKRPVKLIYDLIDAKTRKKIFNKGERLNYIIAKKLATEKNIKEVLVSSTELTGKYTAVDIKDKEKNIFINGKISEYGSKGKIQFDLIKQLEESKKIVISGTILPFDSKIRINEIYQENKNYSKEVMENYETKINNKILKKNLNNIFDVNVIDNLINELN